MYIHESPEYDNYDLKAAASCICDVRVENSKFRVELATKASVQNMQPNTMAILVVS